MKRFLKKGNLNMQIAVDVFIDMMKSQEFHILMIGMIGVWVIMERMNK